MFSLGATSQETVCQQTLSSGDTPLESLLRQTLALQTQSMKQCCDEPHFGKRCCDAPQITKHLNAFKRPATRSPLCWLEFVFVLNVFVPFGMCSYAFWPGSLPRTPKIEKEIAATKLSISVMAFPNHTIMNGLSMITAWALQIEAHKAGVNQKNDKMKENGNEKKTYSKPSRKVGNTKERGTCSRKEKP